MKFYTIGYGGRLPEEFVGLLALHGIRAIADVRIRPDRASMGAYTRARTHDKGIERLLAGQGISYHPILELGNVFFDLEDWRAPYRELLRRSGDLLVARLLEIPCALLSSLCRETRGRMSPADDRGASRRFTRVGRQPHRVARDLGDHSTFPQAHARPIRSAITCLTQRECRFSPGTTI